MARNSGVVPTKAGGYAIAARVMRFGSAITLTGLLLNGCAVEAPHRQAALYNSGQRLSPTGAPATAAVYGGWRLFQDRCASCHGPAATGTPRAPNLLPRIREMDSMRFITHVLYSYEWGIPEQRGGQDALDGLIGNILARRKGEVSLPAVQGEPQVNAYIIDIYDYLSARADGRLGPWRPAR